MKRLFIIVCTITILAFSASSMIDKENAELIDSLEYYLGNVNRIASARHKLMEEMKNQYASMPRGRERAKQAAKIGAEYVKESLDSALIYLSLAQDEAMKSGDRKLSDAILLKEISLYPLAGIEIEAMRLFENFDPAEMNDSLRHEYWLAASQLYYSISCSYNEGRFKQKYIEKTRTAIDSLMQYYEGNVPVANYLTGYKYFLQDEVDLATASFVGAIPELTKHPELRDFSLNIVAQHYKEIPDKRNRYVSYVLQRAVKSLDRGYIRPNALEEAGQVLLEEGYEDLGVRCLKMAISHEDNSYQKNSGRLPGAEYLQYMSVGKQRLAVVYNVAVVFLILLVIMLIFITLRYKRLLVRSDRIIAGKDARIRVLLDEVVKVNTSLVELAFLSLEQLRDFSIHVYRKLQGGQSKDLYDEVSSGSYQNRMQDKFFEVFDNGFLSAFPDFVEKLNTLFVPGKELSLLPGGRMTPELRIAAFLRLGVSDSAKLSQALNLSLNTIYTYRNRLRGRAADRENFEANLMKCI